MASFTERIRLIFDVDSKGAKAGFGDFGKSVREAEGFWGKAKAGAGSLVTTLKDNMGAAAIAGGAALVTFGVKAVGAFTDTAKAAQDASRATGLSVEQASRWIAVADDMGVSAEALTSGVGKIAKTLDADKWKKYGIATRDASGHARSANDVLLDALDLLGRTTNETERARIGQELFGKGFVQLAPLVGKTRAEYEKWLASVEDGQVITDEENKKAEKFRLAMDKLSDALGEVTLAVGETVAGLAPLLNLTADLLGPVAKLTSAIGYMIDEVNTFNPANAFGGWDVALDPAVRKFIEMKEGIRDSAGELAQAQTTWGQFLGTMDSVITKLQETKTEQDALTESLKAQTAASWGLYSAQLALIQGHIDQSAATQAYLASLDSLNTTTDDAKTLVNEHVVALNSAEAAALRVAQAAQDQAKAQAELDGKTLGAKDAALAQVRALTDLAAALDPNSELYKFLQSTIASLNATASSGRDVADALQSFYRSGGQRVR